MNTFIRKILTFSFIFLLINALYLYSCILWDWSFSKRIEALTLENPKYETLILGNSLAMDGIDSEVLSVNFQSTYNLAIGGSSIKTNFIQLQEYLNIASKNPKTVIIGLGSYLNDFHNENINPVVEFTMKGHSYSPKDLPMIKFRWLIYELAKNVISSDHRNATIFEGQLRMGRTVKDNSVYSNPLPMLSLKDYESARYIKKIALLCSENNIDLILVEMPGFKKTQNQTTVGPHKILISKNISIDLYNFNNVDFASKFNSSKDWLGNSHLNKYGASKFTMYLIEKLNP